MLCNYSSEVKRAAFTHWAKYWYGISKSGIFFWKKESSFISRYSQNGLKTLLSCPNPSPAIVFHSFWCKNYPIVRLYIWRFQLHWESRFLQKMHFEGNHIPHWKRFQNDAQCWLIQANQNLRLLIRIWVINLKASLTHSVPGNNCIWLLLHEGAPEIIGIWSWSKTRPCLCITWLTFASCDVFNSLGAAVWIIFTFKLLLPSMVMKRVVNGSHVSEVPVRNSRTVLPGKWVLGFLARPFLNQS